MYISEETKIKIANRRAKEAYERKLAELDYKIIKCYEYSLVNLQLPYNIQELHQEREELRKKIRKLEE